MDDKKTCQELCCINGGQGQLSINPLWSEASLEDKTGWAVYV